MMEPTYTKDMVVQASQDLGGVLQSNRTMTENSLRIRAMAYMAQAKAKLLTETIFEVERGKKIVSRRAGEMQEENERLAMQVEYEQALNQQKERLLWAQSRHTQMGEMLNMITHQWKQPLNAISTSAAYLELKADQGAVDPEALRKGAQRIQAQAQRMFEIINDFMEFNKSGTDAEFCLYEAYEIAKGVIDPLVMDAIDFEVEIDRNLRVYHNVKSIGHVVLNILSNAIDAFKAHPDQTHKQIRIATVTGAETVALVIEDNAGGIPRRILANVFDPYVTTKKNGTGLGLWMSKKMVEKIEGSRIDVSVREGHTRFTVTFCTPSGVKPAPRKVATSV